MIERETLMLVLKDFFIFYKGSLIERIHVVSTKSDNFYPVTIHLPWRIQMLHEIKFHISS